MAYVGLTNVTIAQGGAPDFLYATYAALTSASWATLASGTGAAGGFSSSGSLITSAATFNSTGAWVRMREPGGVGGREYIFQKLGATALTALVKYSRSDGFTNGGSAAVSPTTNSGDGKIIVGGGTEASPTATVNICGATGYVQGVASTTAVNGTYGFWTFQYAAGTGIVGGIMLSEGISPGSTPTSDADPSWRLATSTAASSAQWWSTAGAAVSYWQGYNLAGETYITAGNLGFPAGLNNVNNSTQGVILSPSAATPFGVDPYDSKASFFPLFIGKAATYPKGFSSGIAFGVTTQNQLDVFNIATSEPRIAVATTNFNANGMPLVVVPWVTSIIPTV